MSAFLKQSLLVITGGLLFAQACASSCDPEWAGKTKVSVAITADVRGRNVFITSPEAISLECPIAHYIKVKDAPNEKWTALDFKPETRSRAHFLDDAFRLGGSLVEGCGGPSSLTAKGESLRLPAVYPKELGEKALSDEEALAFQKKNPGFEDQELILVPTYTLAPIRHVRLEFPYGDAPSKIFMQDFVVP